MNRDNQEVFLAVADSLGPVAVMSIKLPDRDPIGATRIMNQQPDKKPMASNPANDRKRSSTTK